MQISLNEYILPLIMEKRPGVCRSSCSPPSTSLRHSATMVPWGAMPRAWPHTLIWYQSTLPGPLCSPAPLHGRSSANQTTVVCSLAGSCLSSLYSLSPRLLLRLMPPAAVADRSGAQRPHGPPERHEAVQEAPVRAAEPLTRLRSRNRSEFRCG